MPTHRDAFIDAAEKARSDLIHDERGNISWREIMRRAGFSESERPGVFYHLNRRRHTGSKPHNVPPDMVRRLAAVLGHERELIAGAQLAAGFNVVDTELGRGDVTLMVQRFYGDAEVTEDERDAVTARLMQILAEETSRRSFPAGRRSKNVTDN